MGSNARQSYRLRSLCPDPVPLLGLTFTFHFLSPWYHFKLFALQPLLSFHLLTLSLSCLSHPSTRLIPMGTGASPTCRSVCGGSWMSRAVLGSQGSWWCAGRSPSPWASCSQSRLLTVMSCCVLVTALRQLCLQPGSCVPVPLCCGLAP